MTTTKRTYQIVAATSIESFVDLQDSTSATAEVVIYQAMIDRLTDLFRKGELVESLQITVEEESQPLCHQRLGRSWALCMSPAVPGKLTLAGEPACEIHGG